MTDARPLRFGIQAGPVDLPYAARCELWQAAERMGYDWASVGDHLMQIPAFGARETDPWLEAWTQLAVLAQATSRIRIGTLVSSVGYRHPGVLAKMAATVDVISGGRLEFGLGAGYAEAEYRMYGLPFPSAGTLAEESPVAKGSSELLADPVAQQLLTSAIPASTAVPLAATA
jgi:alkanesulfonate monooxygenase SsuD/methylene tetrahydromethanopterin reductase-like flavin-dependent oxidoreductase (luciferase family)